MTDTTVPKLTHNQKLIRVTFNANQDPDVKEVKTRYVELLDAIDRLKEKKLATPDKDSDWKSRTAREFAMAKTELESSAHWAVKGVTAHFQD